MLNICSKKNLKHAISNSIEILIQQDNHQECLNAIEKALALSKESPPDPNIIALLGQGWVAEEALAISLYCALCNQTDFQNGVLTAINHSGDSDSTGAITGNILGLILGESKFTKRWIDHLDLAPVVVQISTDLYMLLEEGFGILNMDWFKKYPG